MNIHRIETTFLTFILSLLFQSIFGQISFSESQDILKSDYYSGIAMGVADMNGDFLDDLIILDKAEEFYILYQRENGHFFNPVAMGQAFSNTGAYSLCIGDIDNDYINDYILGYAAGGHLYRNRVTHSEHYFSTDFNVFIQGANFIDFDQDGLLDLYVSNDNNKNKLYKNTGTGYELKENWIDFSTAVPSDNSGNYGSEWIDIDNDCDLDLYISKCRAGVLSPNDPRRINTLYLNDGNNNYIESAKKYGLATGAQSWSTNFGDLDNDGDLDAFTVNHDDYLMLYENDLDNDTFLLKEEYLNDPLFTIGFEGMLCDFNNDTYLDVLITGYNDFLLINNGDFTFSRIDEPFGLQDAHSLSLGDLNNDGFIDVFTSFATEINTPSSYKDKVYLNNGNGNNHIKFTLIGSQSNRNGIGARISIYGDWGIQIREVKAGESYGIANSFTQHFGLGSNNMIDSVVVRWPNCSTQSFYDLSINEHYFINENNCINTRSTIDIIGDKHLCLTDSVRLTAEDGSEYYWNNGSTTRSITTNAPGSYYCRYINIDGCMTWTNTVDVAYMDNRNPTITTADDLINCKGNSPTLETEQAEAYLWSTGETTKTIMPTTSGYYSVTSTTGCQNLYSDSIYITFLDSTIFVYNDTISPGNTASLKVDGDSIFWYENKSSTIAFFNEKIYETPILENSTDYYVSNRDYHIYDSQHLGIEDIDKEESLLYSNNAVNANMIFDVYANTLLKSVKVRTDIAGMRKIELKDKQGELIYSKEIMIDTGTSRIVLNFNISPGTKYELGSNQSYNTTHLGFKSPRLWRENLSVTYPYFIDNLISINNTDKGNIYFYYFLDWEVQQSPVYCESERTIISAIVDTSTHVLNISKQDINIYPNPAGDILNISLEKNIEQIKIYDSLGKLLNYNFQTSAKNLVDIKALKPGIYFIEISFNEFKATKKFIKI